MPVDPLNLVLYALTGLTSLFRGRGGGGAGGADDPETTAMIRALMAQLTAQLQADRLLGLRRTAFTDPGTISLLNAQPELLRQLGISEGVLPEGVMPFAPVPLQEAVVNLAFKLLPRAGRTNLFGTSLMEGAGGPFGATWSRFTGAGGGGGGGGGGGEEKKAPDYKQQPKRPPCPAGQQWSPEHGCYDPIAEPAKAKTPREAGVPPKDWLCAKYPWLCDKMTPQQRESA